MEVIELFSSESLLTDKEYKEYLIYVELEYT